MVVYLIQKRVFHQVTCSCDLVDLYRKTEGLELISVIQVEQYHVPKLSDNELFQHPKIL